MKLSNIDVRNTETVREGLLGQEVLHVWDPHAFTQAAGYLKFICSQENNEGIFFRGQTRLYGSLVPNLFRGIKSKNTQEKRVARFREILIGYRGQCPIFDTFNEEAHEPLLQHYGLKTTWIDIVDNLWIALWFGCYRAKSILENKTYLHFERRLPDKNRVDFVYILLIGADIDSLADSPEGIACGPKTELADLRMASPSIFLRPHSQHGLLFRMRGNNRGRPLDYSDQIRGIIRISLDDALSWLGNSITLNIHTLFPPPYYDFGYRFLLNSEIVHDDVVGSIKHIGA